MERPVTHREMVSLLKSLEFTKVRSNGSHEMWEGTYGGQRRVVTLDEHHAPYHRALLRDIRNQIGMSKKELFAALASL
ncbi:hypothetical protein GCM10011521_12080 [Arenimonas soli]|uniref:Type II toxin-antitoxin system HicA family toxin n=1 Tax=Arenimonas soli TaxID=2269504 RepID=A0ABQ1HFN5_9GAMM|nr:hypothetical protein GCM10011521_12080 [Arenimonas soli]